MSTLVVEVLNNGFVFEQDIRISKSINVAHIRPWIYKEGALQDGQLRLQVYDGATLLKTIDIDFTTINEAFTEDYAHGYIRFDTGPLALNVSDNEANHVYTLKFSMVNHTIDGSNYIAIARNWEITQHAIFGPDPVFSTEEPCGLEIYTYRS